MWNFYLDVKNKIYYVYQHIDDIDKKSRQKVSKNLAGERNQKSEYRKKSMYVYVKKLSVIKKC